MIPIIKTLAAFIVTFLVQLYLADFMTVGGIRPDFVLVLLVYISARYGRMTGILVGFGSGMLQDFAGSFSTLGASALAKAIVGYVLGTLNGTMTVWTPRIVNLYIYGTLMGHAVIYQTVMIQGLQVPPGRLLANIVLEFLLSSIIITAMRYLIPIMPKRA